MLKWATLCAMSEQHSHPLTQAVLTQLQAEIKAHGETITSVSRTMGRNYDTIRRYVIGEKDMPVDVLWAVLDVLKIEPDVFMKRARERAR